MSGNGLPIVNLGTTNTFLGWGVFIVIIGAAVTITTLNVSMAKNIEAVTESVERLEKQMQVERIDSREYVAREVNALKQVIQYEMRKASE